MSGNKELRHFKISNENPKCNTQKQMVSAGIGGKEGEKREVPEEEKRGHPKSGAGEQPLGKAKWMQRQKHQPAGRD